MVICPKCKMDHMITHACRIEDIPFVCSCGYGLENVTSGSENIQCSEPQPTGNVGSGPSFMTNWDGSTIKNPNLLIWKTSDQCKKCMGVRIANYTMTGGNPDCEHEFPQDEKK